MGILSEIPIFILNNTENDDTQRNNKGSIV